MRKYPALFAVALLAAVAARAEDSKPDGQGELNLPWDQFEKLLKLGQDNVSLTWEEFQRLVQQTGVTEMPPFQLQNGRVVLARAEFKRLLDQMKPPAGTDAKYFLTKAVYSVRVSKTGALVSARFRVQVPPSSGGFSPLRVPLFTGSVAFEDILLNGRPALVENEGGRTYVLLTAPGEQEITAAFTASGSFEKPPYSLAFSVPETPITQLELLLPYANAEVNIPGAAAVETVREGAATRVRATLSSTGHVTLTWNAVEIERQKGPAKVYSVAHQLLSIEEDALRVKAQVELEILQNTVNTLNLRVPTGYTVIDVQGEAVGDWKTQGDPARAVLVVPFTYARQGRAALTILAERVMKEKSEMLSFDGFQTLGAVRDSGFLAVELRTTAEAKAVEVSGLQRQDVSELPPSLTGLAQGRPLLFGYKYPRPPFSLGLDVQRHKQVEVISTVVDEANGVTLMLEDGKEVHHITFNVRNSAKQFLELALPEKAQVWTVFVGGRPQKPSKNEKGLLLIPLNRSSSSSGAPEGFDVEVMYFLDRGRPGLASRRDFAFPIPDVVVSQMFWSVYLPHRVDVLYFGGDVDKEAQAEGFRPVSQALLGNRRVLRGLTSSAESLGGEYGEDKPATYEARKKRAEKTAKQSAQWMQRGQFDKDQDVDEEAYARQVEREVNFFSQAREGAFATEGKSNGEAGVLPIRVKVPNTGQVFRFTKRLVTESEPVRLTSFFARGALIGFLKLLVLAGVVLALWRTRRRWSGLRGSVEGFVRNRQGLFEKAFTPAGLTAAGFVLMVLLSILGRLPGVLGFLVFLGFGGRWLWTIVKANRSSR